MDWFQYILDHPEKPWNWQGISRNPNITWDIVEAHPEIPWDWWCLSENPMSKHPMLQKRLLEKKRVQERCSLIKEDLMATAWHPRRVEKWLETGGFELLEAI